jgi:hypothetical protein
MVGFQFHWWVGIRETFVDKLLSLNSVYKPTIIDTCHLKTSFIVCYCYNYGSMQCDECRINKNGEKLHNIKCRISYDFIMENLKIQIYKNKKIVTKLSMSGKFYLINLCNEWVEFL